MDDAQPIDAEESAALKERVRELEAQVAELGQKAEKDTPLKPFQNELLKLQRHIELESIPMIVLFEGRDASGKGGSIRRITRYMNEKRYRIVALGKPTDEQRTQWYFQRYVGTIPGRRRDRYVRSIVVQPSVGRAGLWILHQASVSRFHEGRRRVREGCSPSRNDPGEALLQASIARPRPTALPAVPTTRCGNGS